jgi:hypothetical protein
MGDVLTKSKEKGGLDFGTIGSSAILAAILGIFIVFAVVEENPYNVLTMPVRTENYDPDSDSPSGLFVLLRITHTPKYPDEKPKLMVEESDNMTEDDLEEFQNHLNEIVSHIFSLSSW